MAINNKTFLHQYGPWALIAGASEGIGLAFAEQLAAKGINLVLLSRSAKKLEDAANTITAKHNIEIKLVAADLTTDDCMNAITAATDGLEIGLLIYNAGAVHGAELFLDDPLEKSLALVNLNCRGPVLLAHHFGQPMRRRKRGGMIFLSSMAAFAGGSYVATYSATKAFDIIFPQSLWHEMAPDNINVLCLIAGATRTPAMASSGLDLDTEKEGGPAIMESADVASEGLANLANGPVWIAGEGNRETAKMLDSIPRNDLVEAMSMATADLYNKAYIPVPR